MDINSTDLGHMRILAGRSEALQLWKEVLLTALSPAQCWVKGVTAQSSVC